MSQHWRGPDHEQHPVGRLLRGRWREGSVYVIDSDYNICDPSVTVGLKIEAKHELARDRNWRVTREQARRLGWWSALFVYGTDTGHPGVGNITRLDATLCSPGGAMMQTSTLDLDWFDGFVCKEFGALPKRGAA